MKYRFAGNAPIYTIQIKDTPRNAAALEHVKNGFNTPIASAQSVNIIQINNIHDKWFSIFFQGGFFIAIWFCLLHFCFEANY